MSQGSARTYLKCGGKYYAVSLEIFILYSAVKEFLKIGSDLRKLLPNVWWLPFGDTV